MAIIALHPTTIQRRHCVGLTCSGLGGSENAEAEHHGEEEDAPPPCYDHCLSQHRYSTLFYGLGAQLVKGGV